MSYEIVKKIRLEDNRVFITSACNNVYPRCFEEWESKSLSKILQEQGEEELNFELLKMYEEGNMQEGNPNKWSRAIKRLIETDEYQKKYNWRNSNYDRNCPIRIARNSDSDDYKKFILSSLALKDDVIGKFRIMKNTEGYDMYVLRVTKRLVKYTSKIEESKIFKKQSEIDNLTKIFPFLKIIQA